MAGEELLITRVFDAPVALVFRMWEDQDHKRRWWGPAKFTCTALEQDFRPGGNWSASIESSEHGKYSMGGVFREIERDRRIVFSFAWDKPAGEEREETLVTVTFSEQDGKTVQRFHQAPFATVEERDNHNEGWSTLFDREQAYVEQQARELGI
jgi:uncharacterized protein YndB with AHSA1/START domain